MAFYRCIGGNGGGGVTPTDITPSDSSPVALSANGVYKALAAGYAIESYSSKTPDDTTPPAVSNGEIVKMGGAGYLYASQQTSAVMYSKSGTLPDFTAANQEQSVDTGLTEIEYFYVEGYANNNTAYSVSTLDMNRTFAKQITSNNSTTASGGSNSGTNASGIITTANTQIKVSAISGGTVTIKTGNTAAYAHKNVKWYAG